jgi:hypothetical protein
MVLSSALNRLPLDLLLLLLRECLNCEGLQAERVAHSSFCKLDELLSHHFRDWVFALNQAQCLQDVIEDLAKHRNVFGLV